MAYIPGYDHDIFISYCHLDNLKQFNEPQGWIENFCNNLEASLWKLTGTRDVAIWWDEKGLEGNTVFDDSISNAVNNSAILLCLNSPSYLNSEYCKKELDQFYNYATRDGSQGIRVGDQLRILNVLLYNIPHEEWPHEFSGAAGFPFYDLGKKRGSGHPFQMNSSQFSDTFLSFCESVVKLMEGFGNPGPVPPPVFDIFFSDVPDTLRNTRKRTIAELKKQKFEIIPDVPPPYEKNEHETTVNQKLEKAELAVHLLDQFPGRNIEGEESEWYPQKQAELSLLTSKPKFIWVPADLNIETIEDEKYRTFLSDLENGNLPATGIRYVRSPKSEVTQQLIDLTRTVQEDWHGVQDGKVSVLIDTHFNDQLYALELSKCLLENEIQPFINSQEGDPKKNITILENRIRQVSKLVFFYGKVSHDWVRERMTAAIQLVVSKRYPIKDFFVLMLPPHKNPEPIMLPQSAVRINVINNSDTRQLDINSLQPLFNSIKALS